MSDIRVSQERILDFDFITRSLGLVPISYVTAGGENRMVGINPMAITSIHRDQQPTGDLFTITLRNNEQHLLSYLEMTELEATIKRREAEAKARQQEAIREQLTTQHATVQELNRQEQNRIQQGMIIGAPPGKKGRI